VVVVGVTVVVVVVATVVVGERTVVVVGVVVERRFFEGVDVVGGGPDVVVGGVVVGGVVDVDVVPTVPSVNFAGVVWKLSTPTSPAKVPAMTSGDRLMLLARCVGSSSSIFLVS